MGKSFHFEVGMFLRVVQFIFVCSINILFLPTIVLANFHGSIACEKIYSQITQSAAPITLDSKSSNQPLKDPVPFGTMRLIGKKQFEFDHNSDYKVLVKQESEIKNQCNLSTCHLHAWVTMLEHDYLKSNPHSIRLSTHYLSAKLWLKRSLDAIDNKHKNSVTLEANVLESKKSIEEFGLIPDEIWQLNRNFQRAPYSDRMQEYIQNIVSRAKWDVEQEFDERAKKHIREDAKQKIRDLFESMIGPFPEQFEYAGKTYDPKSFMRHFFPTVAAPLARIGVNTFDTSANTVNKHESDSYNMNINSVEKIVRQLLDKGETVYLSYDHNPHFVDTNTGIMSLSAFSYPKEAAPLSREQRNFCNHKCSGHAVQIIGYDYDLETNKVIKWKIQNSWGEQRGERGFYNMYNDYFHTYAIEISFTNQKELGIILPK